MLNGVTMTIKPGEEPIYIEVGDIKIEISKYLFEKQNVVHIYIEHINNTKNLNEIRIYNDVCTKDRKIDNCHHLIVVKDK